MKEMNFDFLRDIARSENEIPQSYSSDLVGNEMSPLGALMWNARIHMGLSQEEFANKCDIDVCDVVKAEEEIDYLVDTRTIYAVSRFLKIDNSALAEISGFIKLRDPLYEQKIYSFAASSRRIRDCSEGNLEIFEQYLAVLHERSQHGG